MGRRRGEEEEGEKKEMVKWHSPRQSN